MLHAGFHSFINPDKIWSIVPAHVNNRNAMSMPIHRLVKAASDNDTLFDFTFGRRTKSIIFLDSGQLVLSALAPETINSRMEEVMKNGH